MESIVSADTQKDVVSGDVIATPEKAVRDSILKVNSEDGSQVPPPPVAQVTYLKISNPDPNEEPEFYYVDSTGNPTWTQPTNGVIINMASGNAKVPASQPAVEGDTQATVEAQEKSLNKASPQPRVSGLNKKLSVASQEKVVPEKKGVPKKRETEERGCQDDAIKTESEVANKQQPPPPPVGPVSPVPPPISAPLPPEVCGVEGEAMSETSALPVTSRSHCDQSDQDRGGSLREMSYRRSDRRSIRRNEQSDQSDQDRGGSLREMSYRRSNRRSIRRNEQRDSRYRLHDRNRRGYSEQREGGVTAFGVQQIVGGLVVVHTQATDVEEPSPFSLNDRLCSL